MSVRLVDFRGAIDEAHTWQWGLHGSATPPVQQPTRVHEGQNLNLPPAEGPRPRRASVTVGEAEWH
jgi:hypothetical protein